MENLLLKLLYAMDWCENWYKVFTGTLKRFSAKHSETDVARGLRPAPDGTGLGHSFPYCSQVMKVWLNILPGPTHQCSQRELQGPAWYMLESPWERWDPCRGAVPMLFQKMSSWKLPAVSIALCLSVLLSGSYSFVIWNSYNKILFILANFWLQDFSLIPT